MSIYTRESVIMPLTSMWTVGNNANSDVNNIRSIQRKLSCNDIHILKEKNINFYSKEINRTVCEFVIFHYLLLVE